MATQIDELFVALGFRAGDDSAAEAFESRLKTIRRQVNAVANRMVILGGAGAGALGLVAKTGINTDESLRRAGAALALTEMQMGQLYDEAIRAGSALPLEYR